MGFSQYNRWPKSNITIKINFKVKYWGYWATVLYKRGKKGSDNTLCPKTKCPGSWKCPLGSSFIKGGKGASELIPKLPLKLIFVTVILLARPSCQLDTAKKSGRVSVQQLPWSSRWVCSYVCRECLHYWLMWKGQAHCAGTTPGLVALGKLVDHKPWRASQWAFFLHGPCCSSCLWSPPMSSHLGFPSWLTVACKWNKPFLPSGRFWSVLYDSKVEGYKLDLPCPISLSCHLGYIFSEKNTVLPFKCASGIVFQ